VFIILNQGAVTTKEETDMSIHNKEDVTVTDEVCEPEVSHILR